jgi:hypothetical protein
MPGVTWRVKDDPTAEDPNESWTIMLGGERDRCTWPRPTTYEGNVPPQPCPEEFPDQESYETTQDRTHRRSSIIAT